MHLVMAGIDVGHQFFSRAEMVVVGFHHHWLNGIDYIGKSGKAAQKSVKEFVSLNCGKFDMMWLNLERFYCS